MKKLFRFVLLVSFALVLRGSSFAQVPAEPATPKPADHGAPQSPLAKCLPAGIQLGDIVEATMAGNASGQPVKPRQITVEQKLKELKATCNREDKLVDGNGRQIVFYHLIGCWGYPPPDYQALLQKQRGEIERLKQQYTVIAMTCNPSGVRISSLKKEGAYSPA